MCNVAVVAVVGVKEAWQEICCCHSFLLLLVAKTTYITFCSFYRKSMTDSFFFSYFFFSNCKTCIIKKIQPVTMPFFGLLLTLNQNENASGDYCALVYWRLKRWPLCMLLFKTIIFKNKNKYYGWKYTTKVHSA